MPRSTLSRRTLTEFREWLVGWTLRTITDLFEGYGFEHVLLPPDELPGGQRRSLVECFYAGIDLGDPEQTRRLLSVFEDILFEIPATHEEGKQKLVRLLERDGFEFRDGRIADPRPPVEIDLHAVPSTLDTDHLSIYLDRIKDSIDSDPELAIGSTKDLLEATLKSILLGSGVSFDDRNDDIPTLLKKVQRLLHLAPDQVDTSRRGADRIRRILSNLGGVAIGIGELRNLYGSGHGRSAPRIVDSRLARLVVGSGGVLCRFLLETYEFRNASQPNKTVEADAPKPARRSP